MVAWNLSLLPKVERSEAMQVKSQGLPADLAKFGLMMVNLLIARKLELFPDLQRRIIDF